MTLSLSLGLGLTTLKQGGGEDPLLKLFANGENGFYVPVMTKTQLFQNSDGSTQVAQNDDPVGLAKDRSGKANHLSQVTAGLRPLWKENAGKPYLALDGANGRLLSSFIPTPAATLAVAFRAANTGANQTLLGGGNSTGNLRCFIGIGTTNRITCGWGSETYGSVPLGVDISGGDHFALLTGNAATREVWLDGVKLDERGFSGTSPGGGAGIALGVYNNNGSQANFLNGRVYSALALNRRATADEIAQINAYLQQVLVVGASAYLYDDDYVDEGSLFA